jgi:hypothetical protein
MVKSMIQIARSTRAGAALLVFGAVLLMTGIPLSNAAPQSEQNRGFVQEGLGSAIVSAANATTPNEKARTQEVLGMLIVQAAFQDQSRESAGSTSHPASSSVPTEWHETRGESASYIFAALGGTAMLIWAFFAFPKESVPAVPKPAS